MSSALHRPQQRPIRLSHFSDYACTWLGVGPGRLTAVHGRFTAPLGAEHSQRFEHCLRQSEQVHQHGPIERLSGVVFSYQSFDRQATTLFIQLVSRRYKSGLIVLTNRQSFGSCGDVFGDCATANAVLDRILRVATTISIRGDPCWLREEFQPRSG